MNNLNCDIIKSNSVKLPRQILKIVFYLLYYNNIYYEFIYIYIYF